MAYPPEFAHLRASDADRHRVSEVLRDAAAEGRIDLAELEQRLEATYSAKTYADLAPITADLPPRLPGGGAPLAHAGVPVPVSATAGGVPALVLRHEQSFSFLTTQARKGVWQVPPSHTVTAMLGSVDLDLRQAVFTARETVVRCLAVCGTVKVTVNPNTHVVIDGVGAAGDFKQRRDLAPPQLGPDSPVVRLTGYAVAGEVVVVRRPLPSEGRRRLWGGRRR